MSQQYFYPVQPVSGTIIASNPSIGPTGSPAPADATEVGGVGLDGNLHALSTDNSGVLNVNTTPAAGSVQHVIVDSSALPTGASTSALQTSGNTLLTTVASNQTNGTQVTSVNNFPATQPVSGTITVVQPTGTNLHSVIDSSALPTGASTSALQTTANTSLASIVTNTGNIPTNGQKAMAASLPVAIASDQSAIPVSGSVTVSGTVAATQSGTWTVQPGNTANTTPWLSTISQGGNSAAVSASNALKVDGSAVTQPVSGTVTANAGTGNFTVIQPTAANLNATVTGTVTSNVAGNTQANASSFNDYTSTSVTTAAYVQLVASTSNTTAAIEIFDSSGQGMILATGAAASEVDQLFIFPGGNGRIPFQIPSGTRVSIKAKTATASVGFIMINYYK